MLKKRRNGEPKKRVVWEDELPKKQENHEAVCTANSHQNSQNSAVKVPVKEVDVDKQLLSTCTKSNDFAFSTEQVMVEILRYLDYADLKMCREVSSQFKFFANKVMPLRIASSHVRFQFDWTMQSYFGVMTYESGLGTRRESELSLTAFTKFLEESPTFPCESFTFEEGTLQSRDLQFFLMVHGRRIKQLRLDVFHPPQQISHHLLSQHIPALASLWNLLTEHVPNVVDLELSKFPEHWRLPIHYALEDPSSFDMILPNVKCLTFRDLDQADAVRYLIKICVNVEQVKMFQTILPLLEGNTFHLLKEFEMNPQLRKEMDLVDSLILTKKLKSQLRYLAIATDTVAETDSKYFPRLTRILQNLLLASCSSLNQIHFKSPLAFLSDLVIPVIPSVESITVSNLNRLNFPPNSGYSKKQFPPGFQFSHVFPNLKRVTFRTQFEIDSGNWAHYHDNYAPVLTVSSLCIKDSTLPCGWMGELSTLFPNVTSLEVTSTCFNVTEAAYSGLWKFKELRHLSLGINVRHSSSVWPALDVAFTGFSPHTCQWLSEEVSEQSSEVEAEVDLTNSDCDQGSLIEDADVEYFSQFRVYPSILDLKNLVTLRLKLVDRFREAAEYGTLLTDLTGILAFRMCPKLEVSLLYKVANLENIPELRKSIKGILNHVTHSKI